MRCFIALAALGWFAASVCADEKAEAKPAKPRLALHVGKIITCAGKPIAEITPVGRAADRNPEVEEAQPLTELRPIGLAEGLFLEAPDFDAPLPEEFLRLFEG